MAPPRCKEPGCHEFNISVSPKDPNHVFIFEVYDNAAALRSAPRHRSFQEICGDDKDMVAKRELRALCVGGDQ